MSSLKDVTDSVERLEATEASCGVTLNALSAFQNSDNVFVQGDLHLVEGTHLKSDIELQVVVYDENQRVIGKGNVEVCKDNFYVYSSFQAHVRTPKRRAKRIRIHVRSA